MKALLFFFVSGVAFFFSGCGKNCPPKQGGTLYLHADSKSWVIFTDSPVVFKNQNNDSITLTYSSPVDTIIALFWYCTDDCKRCNPEEFMLEKMYTRFGDFTIQILPGGYPAFSSYDSLFITSYSNNPAGGVLHDGIIEDKTILHFDSIQLNNTTFYDVYEDTTSMSGYDSGLVLHYHFSPLYFTKQDGIIAFADHSNLLWVRQ